MHAKSSKTITIYHYKAVYAKLTQESSARSESPISKQNKNGINTQPWYY